MYTSKDSVRVMILADRFRIEGRMHILAGSRLTDALNAKSKDFFALTDAKVTLMDAEQTSHEAPYMVVSRNAIDAILPLEDVKPG